MYGHFDSLMFRIVFVCVLPTLLRTKQLPGKWAIPVTNNGTVLRGFAIAGQDRLCYDVKDRSLDDSVTTKDVTAKRPVYRKKTSKSMKRVGRTKIKRRHSDKSKKDFWKMVWVKKESSSMNSGLSACPVQGGKPTAALVESDKMQTMDRGNDNMIFTASADVITVTQVEDQTANLSKMVPCKTFTQQTMPPKGNQQTHVLTTKLPTQWSCLPSHETALPRWMTTAQHIPITLPTCRPYTSVYNPMTRWFLKMTTVINRWSRKSKVTKPQLA